MPHQKIPHAGYDDDDFDDDCEAGGGYDENDDDDGHVVWHVAYVVDADAGALLQQVNSPQCHADVAAYDDYDDAETADVVADAMHDAYYCCCSFLILSYRGVGVGLQQRLRQHYLKPVTSANVCYCCCG